MNCTTKPPVSLMDLQPASAVYPGHPLTLACWVLKKHPQWGVPGTESVSYQELLADWDIPGARGPVKAALATIEKARLEGLESAKSFAQQYWRGETNNGYQAAFQEGALQAQALEPLFAQLLGDALSIA